MIRAGQRPGFSAFAKGGQRLHDANGGSFDYYGRVLCQIRADGGGVAIRDCNSGVTHHICTQTYEDDDCVRSDEMTVKNPVTPFDKGQAAAREGSPSENPFAEGTVEFNNFELGYRFGLQKLRTPAMGGGAAAAR